MNNQEKALSLLVEIYDWYQDFELGADLNKVLNLPISEIADLFEDLSYSEITGNQWVCTDPDTWQFRMELNELDLYEQKYVFRQFEGTSEEITAIGEMTYSKEKMLLTQLWPTGRWVEMIIDLRKYTEEQKRDYCLAFYSKKEYEDGLQPEIIAECIFESEFPNIPT